MQFVYVGDDHNFAGTDTETDEFAAAYPGSLKICLYAGQDPKKVFLTAEAIVVPPPPVVIYFTVANACSFNPGLGAPHAIQTELGPGVWWKTALPNTYVVAFSFEGDSKVDAAIEEKEGVLLYEARCAPHETRWISAQELQQLQQNPPTTASQPPSSPSQPLSSPPMSPAASAYWTDRQNKALAGVHSSFVFDPEPATGYTDVISNTNQLCGDIATSCLRNGLPLLG